MRNFSSVGSEFSKMLNIVLVPKCFLKGQEALGSLEKQFCCFETVSYCFKRCHNPNEIILSRPIRRSPFPRLHLGSWESTRNSISCLGNSLGQSSAFKAFWVCRISWCIRLTTKTKKSTQLRGDMLRGYPAAEEEKQIKLVV